MAYNNLAALIEQYRKLNQPQELYSPMSEEQKIELAQEPVMTRAPGGQSAPLFEQPAAPPPAPSVQQPEVDTMQGFPNTQEIMAGLNPVFAKTDPAPSPPQQAAPPPTPVPAASPLQDILAQFKAMRSAPPQIDQELLDAQRSRQQGMQTAGLAEAASQIGAGIAGLGAGSVIKPTGDFTAIRQGAQQSYEDLLTRRKSAAEGKKSKRDEMMDELGLGLKLDEFGRTAEKENLELQLKRDMSDPNSMVTKLYRDAYEKAMKKPAPPNVTAAQFAQLGVTIPKADQELSMQLRQASLDLREREFGLKEKSEERRGEQFTFKQDETGKGRNEKIIKEYNKDDVVKVSNKSLAQVTKAREVLTKGGKLAPSVMGRILARMAGEVGVMTDKDVEAFKGSPKWTDEIARFFTRGTMGQLTNEDKKAMMNFVNLAENAEINNLKTRADIISSQYSAANPDMTKDSIYGMIKPAIDAYESVKITLPDGRAARVPRLNLDEAIRRGASVVEGE